MPTDPGSAFQVAVRNAFTTLAQAWVNVLTNGQRTGWELYAANVLIPDKLGEPRNIGGLGQYVRSNVPRLQAGLARIDAAPGIFTLGELTAPSALVSAPSDIDVSFTNGDDWAGVVGGALLVYASKPVNPTVNFYKGPYRLAEAILGAASPPASPQTVTAPFVYAAGQKVFLQFRSTDAIGRLSGVFRTDSLVSA